jgi:hypothetical protein
MAEEIVPSLASSSPAAGPIVHRVVLWNVRPDTTAEQIEALNVKGRELLLQIPGVEDLSSGVALEPDAPYKYYALITLSSVEMVGAFNQHPLHALFGELYFNHIIAGHSVVDYAILKT